MSGVKQIEVVVSGMKDLALISTVNDSVWLVVPLRWWDLSTLIWWVFCPMDRKAWIQLTLTDGAKVRCRAVRVSTRYVRCRGFG